MKKVIMPKFLDFVLEHFLTIFVGLSILILLSLKFVVDYPFPFITIGIIFSLFIFFSSIALIKKGIEILLVNKKKGLVTLFAGYIVAIIGFVCLHFFIQCQLRCSGDT